MLDAITVTADRPTFQYQRRVSIVIAGAGQRWDFANFRCRFEVRRGDSQAPNTADVRIYNLRDDAANQIAPVTSEFKTLTIKVGYGENTPPEQLGQIFTGTICQVRVGRESALDTYVDITAADGDRAYNFATISASMVAANPAGIAATLQNAMSAHGVTQGTKPAFSTSSVLSRGKVLYGPAKDELRDFCQDVNVAWSVQDQLLTYISMTALQPGPPLKLTPTSGLIGTPEQTQNGITVRSLMNPSIKIGSLIVLDATINRQRYPTDYLSVAGSLATSQQNRINAENQYYVMWVEHSGDTRGTEWYSTMTCLAVDANLIDVDLTGALIAPLGPIVRYGPDGPALNPDGSPILIGG
jgi:hypothetical protein